MNDLIVILAVVVSVVGLGVLIGCLKKTKVVEEDFSKDLSSTIGIAKLFFEVLPLDEKIQDKSKFIFEIADTVSEYVHYLEDDNVDKEKVTLDTALDILNKVGIAPTDAEKQLMVMGISASLKWLVDKEKENTF